MKFKVGDKVRHTYKNLHGIVIVVLKNGNCGVDFGKGFDGHNLEGRMETRNGWYVPEENLETAKQSNKHIY